MSQALQAQVQACGEIAQLSQAEIDQVKSAVPALEAAVIGGQEVAHKSGGKLSVTVARVAATGKVLGRVNYEAPSGKRGKTDVDM